MKNSEFKALTKHLVERFPQLAYKNKLLFFVPVASVLRGFLFESSSYTKEHFYVYEFFQPLYIPADHVTLLFGHRLRNKKLWRRDEPALDQILSFEIQGGLTRLSELQSAESVASALENFVTPNAIGYVNPHCREALAYSLIKTKQMELADQVLGALINSLVPSHAWEQQVLIRASLIRDMLLANPSEAMKQLLLWEGETVRHLKLEEFLAPSDLVTAGE